MFTNSVWNIYCLNQIVHGKDPASLEADVEGGLSADKLEELSRRIKNMGEPKFDDMDKLFLNVLRSGEYATANTGEHSVAMAAFADYCRSEDVLASKMAEHSLALFSEIKPTNLSKPYVSDGVLYVPEKFKDARLERKMYRMFSYFVWGFDEEDFMHNGQPSRNRSEAVQTICKIHHILRYFGSISFTSRNLYSLLNKCITLDINPSTLGRTTLCIPDLNPVYERTGGFVWWTRPEKTAVGVLVPGSGSKSAFKCVIDTEEFMNTCAGDIMAPSKLLLKGGSLVLGK